MGKTTKNFSMHSGGLTPEEREEATKFLKEKDEQRQKSMASKANEAHEKKASVDFMNVNFEPFEDRILVFPDMVEDKTKGGLYKPDSTVTREKPMIGTVVVVGPGKLGLNSSALIKALGYQADNEMQRMREEYPMWTGNDFIELLQEGRLNLKAGDRVSYGNFAGTEFPIGEVKYLIMRFADCFGKVV